MLEIPVEYKITSADFIQNIDLDNTNYTIRLTYNIRVGFWFITLITENYKLNSIKCVIDYPIFSQHKALIPELSGDFFINKVTNLDEKTELSYDNFGTVYRLLYYTQEELEIWERENGLRA